MKKKLRFDSLQFFKNYTFFSCRGVPKMPQIASLEIYFLKFSRGGMPTEPLVPWALHELAIHPLATFKFWKNLWRTLVIFSFMFCLL